MTLLNRVLNLRHFHAPTHCVLAGLRSWTWNPVQAILMVFLLSKEQHRYLQLCLSYVKLKLKDCPARNWSSLLFIKHSFFFPVLWSHQVLSNVQPQMAYSHILPLVSEIWNTFFFLTSKKFCLKILFYFWLVNYWEAGDKTYVYYTETGFLIELLLSWGQKRKKFSFPCGCFTLRSCVYSCSYFHRASNIIFFWSYSMLLYSVLSSMRGLEGWYSCNVIYTS